MFPMGASFLACGSRLVACGGRSSSETGTVSPGTTGGAANGGTSPTGGASGDGAGGESAGASATGGTGGTAGSSSGAAGAGAMAGAPAAGSSGAAGEPQATGGQPSGPCPLSWSPPNYPPNYYNTPNCFHTPEYKCSMGTICCSHSCIVDCSSAGNEGCGDFPQCIEVWQCNQGGELPYVGP